jgi:chemotaxis protein CheD
MKKPSHAIEIFLQPGEHYFGDRDTRIRTLLGSCVAITLWHPGLLVGGMCHYMLPSRGARSGVPDGKYGDEAVELMLEGIRHAGASHREFQAKLFGGGNMFPHPLTQCGQHIGQKNVEAGRMLLKRLGLVIHAEHLGGAGHRNLLFDVWSGHVWMKHQQIDRSPCDNCKDRSLCLAA